jgi:long-subunit fatty acid transport protein
MNRPEKPEELVELAKKLDAEWQDGNVIGVGTGYGRGRGLTLAFGWRLYVYARDPATAKSKYPDKVGDYEVLFRGEVRALV